MICRELSDKMPAVAKGLASWTDAEAEHLRSCAECRAEWAVVSAGAAVGEGASLDADALAARVLERLRTEPVMRRRHRPIWIAGVAAAAAVVLLLARASVPAPLLRSPAAPLSSGPAAQPLAVHVAGLTSLNAAGLTEVLESFDTMWTETSTSDAPSLDDLDPQELEQVRGSWEI